MSVIWKSIPGYENRYEISSLGEVYPKKRPGVKHRILLSEHQDSPCAYVNLFDGSSYRVLYLDPLMADLFLGLDPSTVLKHLDGDMFNCSVDNLAVYRFSLTRRQKPANIEAWNRTRKTATALKWYRTTRSNTSTCF